jgi:hypothetical protein
MRDIWTAPVDGCYMGVVGASFAVAHVSGAVAVLLYEATKNAAVLIAAEDPGGRGRRKNGGC